MNVRAIAAVTGIPSDASWLPVALRPGLALWAGVGVWLYLQAVRQP